jgi:hypothetical protein
MIHGFEADELLGLFFMLLALLIAMMGCTHV